MMNHLNAEDEEEGHQDSQPESRWLEAYREYMKPVLSPEERDRVLVGTRPEHDRYIKKCEKMWEVAEDRFALTDWKELYTDIEEGIYSWQRDTDSGLKSTKI